MQQYKETKIDRFNRAQKQREWLKQQEPLPDTCCVAFVVTAAVAAGVGAVMGGL